MIAPLMERRVFWAAVAVVALCALWLRFWGLSYGLPQSFNADEPHHVNVAISFGRGSLNPLLFKYPTLWMYTMFGAYGAFFVGWSGFGLLRSVSDFGALFAWNSGTFYLIARLLSAGFSVLGLIAVYRSALALERPRVGLWAATLLAASPTLVVSAHAAKPDSLMFFFAAFAWLLALRYLDSGKKRALFACAAATGLCVSTQYVAAPIILLGPLVWAARWLETGEASPRLLAICGAVVPAAFFAGSPFVLIAWRSAWRDIADTGVMASVGDPAGVVVLKNLGTFADPLFLGGVFAVGGLAWLYRSRRSLALVFSIPILVQVVFLACSPNGGWARFLIPVFPALALAAAFAIESLLLKIKHSEPLRALVLIVLLAPGAVSAWAFDSELVLPDTRTSAEAWIREEIPRNASILTFNPHTAPRLQPSKEHVETLLKKLGTHPRARLYGIMAKTHPGGGFRVYRIAQDADVLQSGPQHVKFSSAGRAVVDVREGVAPARRAGVEYFVYTSYGTNAEGFRRLSKFLSEIERESDLIKEFSPEPDIRRGPVVKIYRIKEPVS